MRRMQGWDERKKSDGDNCSRVAAVATSVRPTGLHGTLLILETKIDYS